jgi:hypothetical protein
MKRTGAAVLVVLLSTAAAGCAGSHRVSAPVHRTNAAAHKRFAQTPAGRFWARQGRLDALANHAERVAGAAHVFGGVRVDDAANRDILYLVHAPQSVIDELRNGHPNTYVIHNNAARTLGSLLQLQRSLMTADWPAHGVYIGMSEPTLDGHLTVGVGGNIAKAQEALDAAYGRGVIRVVHAEPTGLTDAHGPTG